jgi:hypothetical protein
MIFEPGGENRPSHCLVSSKRFLPLDTGITSLDALRKSVLRSPNGEHWRGLRIAHFLAG